MAKSIALLFSGQGAQQVGMGKDLSQQFAAAANRFAAADTALGYSISQIAFDGPIEELTKTSRCQVALYVHGIAVLEVLREQLGDFQVVAAAGLIARGIHRPRGGRYIRLLDRPSIGRESRTIHGRGLRRYVRDHGRVHRR